MIDMTEREIVQELRDIAARINRSGANASLVISSSDNNDASRCSVLVRTGYETNDYTEHCNDSTIGGALAKAGLFSIKFVEGNRKMTPGDIGL